MVPTLIACSLWSEGLEGDVRVLEVIFPQRTMMRSCSAHDDEVVPAREMAHNAASQRARRVGRERAVRRRRALAGDGGPLEDRSRALALGDVARLLQRQLARPRRSVLAHRLALELIRRDVKKCQSKFTKIKGMVTIL